MREHERGRNAAVSGEGIDYTLQIFWFRKRTASHKTIITGDTHYVQNFRHGFKQRNVALNVLMRGAHPYDGLKAKANGPQIDPRRVAANNARILEFLDSLAHGRMIVV